MPGGKPGIREKPIHSQDLVILLGAIPLFAGLSEADLRAVVSHAHAKTYRKNTVVIEKGDQSTSLYILISGRVRVYLANEEGKELLLHTLETGDYFGELALLGDIARTASVMTETDCNLLVVSKPAFLDCLRAHPEIALETIRHLARKLSDLTERTGTLALLDVYGRVAAVLRERSRQEDGRMITDRLTHQELAQIVGSSREMISRIIKELKQGGYIDVENKRVVLKRKLPARW